MPLLNYTTSISATKTASEIQSMLVKAKAQAVLSEYDDIGLMTAMSFRILTPHGVVFFRLPARTDGVFSAMKRNPKIANRYKTRAQAINVAWRILKDWVQAQLAIVETEMAEMAEVFLPYAQNGEGKTLYETIEQGGFKLLANHQE